MVDSVAIGSSAVEKVDGGHWTSIRGSHHLLQVVDRYGSRAEVDKSTMKTVRRSVSVFQTCSECKKKIYNFYRSVRHGSLEVAFVSCPCDQFAVVALDEKVVGKLSVPFDSTKAHDESEDHGYNRSVWSSSKRLLYCEKTSRLVVEYQWKDLEAGVFDKHRRLSYSLGILSNSKTADLIFECCMVSVLLKDGSLNLGGKEFKIKGSFA